MLVTDRLPPRPRQQVISSQADKTCGTASWLTLSGLSCPVLTCTQVHSCVLHLMWHLRGVPLLACGQGHALLLSLAVAGLVLRPVLMDQNSCRQLGYALCCGCRVLQRQWQGRGAAVRSKQAHYRRHECSKATGVLVLVLGLGAGFSTSRGTAHEQAVHSGSVKQLFGACLQHQCCLHVAQVQYGMLADWKLVSAASGNPLSAVALAALLGVLHCGRAMAMRRCHGSGKWLSQLVALTSPFCSPGR